MVNLIKRLFGIKSKPNSWKGLNENIKRNDEIWSTYGRNR